MQIAVKTNKLLATDKTPEKIFKRANILYEEFSIGASILSQSVQLVLRMFLICPTEILNRVVKTSVGHKDELPTSKPLLC